MSKKMKFYLTGTITSILMVFVWIFVTVGLTGGRDIEEFTQTDWNYLYIMLAAEVITFAVMAFFTAKLSKLNRATAQEINRKAQMQKTQLANKRGLLVAALALVAMCAFWFLGARLVNILPPWVIDAASFGLIFGISLPLLSYPINFFLAKKFQKKFKKMSAAESQSFFLSHREEAEKTAVAKQARLLQLQRRMDLWAWILGFCGALTAFCFGLYTDTNALCMLSLPGLLPAVARIRLPQSKKVLDQSDYVDRSDYPCLYGLAEKARDTMDCHGNIRIALSYDCNAGIRDSNGTYDIILGTTLLNLLSEQELYTCLLHEFGHMCHRTPRQKKLEKYDLWLNSGATNYIFSGFFDLTFLYLTVQYGFENFLYHYALSVTEETNADRAAVEHCNKEAFASALLKLKYHELYQWEAPALDRTSDYASEEVDFTFAHKELTTLRTAFAQREQVWKELVGKEILARNASHPTAAMRLAAMEITNYQLLPFPADGAYAQECEKALCHLERHIAEEIITPQYEALRKDNYLDPLQRITAWEEADKPLTAETYADLWGALSALGRLTEAEALSDRAIATFPEAAVRFAYFNKGQFLLRRYDPAGVDMLYIALENSNYLDDALQMIGSFACLVGD